MMIQPTVNSVAKVIYRRKWSIALTALLVAALGAAYLITTAPIYRSTGSVVVRFGRSAVPTTNLAQDSTSYVIDQFERRELVQAHADILSGHDLAEASIEKFGLARLYPTLAEHPPAVGTAMDAAIKQFQPALFVSTELFGNVINLAFSHPDPKVAKAMLDIVLDEYMRRESEVFSDTNYAFQKTQADLAQKRLLAAQDALSAYKASSGVSAFDWQMSTMIKQQSELKSRLSISQVSLVESTQRRDTLARLLQTVSEAVTSSANDKYRQVDEAQSRVNELQTREREMVASHGTDWPALRGLRASIAEAQAGTAAMASASSGRRETRTSTVYQSVQTDLLRVTAEVQSNQQAVSLMAGQTKELEKQINALESNRSGLVERQREVDLADAAYRTTTLQMEDSRIGNDLQRDGISRVAVITQPNLPYAPFSPRYRIAGMSILAAAVLIGLFVGFMLELLDDRFVSSEQVVNRLKVPVLATFDKV